MPRKERWPRDYSLLLFAPSSGVRTWCRGLLAQPLFDQAIILAIVASSVCLALDSPRLDPASGLAHALARLDLFFTGARTPPSHRTSHKAGTRATA